MKIYRLNEKSKKCTLPSGADIPWYTPLRLFHKFAKGLIDGSVQNSSIHLLSPIHANIRLEEFVSKNAKVLRYFK